MERHSARRSTRSVESTPLHSRGRFFQDQGSRIDLLLGAPGRVECYLEVKNVTAKGIDGAAIFPDAPTERGRKHLQELLGMVRAGYRAVLLLHVAREDVSVFRAATEIDPVYADLLCEVQAQGVEVQAWVSQVTPGSIAIRHAIPVATGLGNL